jgi:hypothetical protein
LYCAIAYASAAVSSDAEALGGGIGVADAVARSSASAIAAKWAGSAGVSIDIESEATGLEPRIPEPSGYPGANALAGLLLPAPGRRGRISNLDDAPHDHAVARLADLRART